MLTTPGLIKPEQCKPHCGGWWWEESETLWWRHRLCWVQLEWQRRRRRRRLEEELPHHTLPCFLSGEESLKLKVLYKWRVARTYLPTRVPLLRVKFMWRKEWSCTKKSDIRITYKRCVICYTTWLCLAHYKRYLAQNMDVNEHASLQLLCSI